MMNVLFRRELARLWFPASLCALGLLLAWTKIVLQGTHPNQVSVPWIDGSTFLISTLGFAAVALLLGFLQGRRDGSGTAWAVWQLRPISFFRVFLAKILVGSSVLVVITLGLSAAVFLWSSVPGHMLGPLRVSMYTPIIVDAGMALVYYITGLTLGIGKGGWFTYRLLPLGVPILGSLMSLGAPTYGLAILVIVVSGLIAVLAAWGVFQMGDSGRTANPVPSTAIHFSRFVGVSILLVVVICSVFIYTDIAPFKSVSDQKGYYLTFDRQGNATLRTGPVRKDKDLASSFMFHRIAPRQVVRYRPNRSDYQIPNQYNSQEIIWYFLPHEATFVGYHRLERTVSKSWKLSDQLCGDRPCQPSDLIEMIDTEDPLVITKSAVFQVNLTTSKTNIVYQSPGQTIVGGGNTRIHRQFQEQFDHYIWIWERHQITFIPSKTYQPKSTIKLPLPTEAQNANRLSAYLGDQEKVFVHVINDQHDQNQSWITIASNPPVSRTLPTFPTAVFREHLRPSVAIALSPVELGFYLLIEAIQSNQRPTFVVPLSFWVVVSLISLLSGLVSVWLAFRHQASRSSKILSFFGGLLGGLAGLIVVGLVYPFRRASSHPSDRQVSYNS